jgi:two-component system, sensor histidine kinase RpfC
MECEAVLDIAHLGRMTGDARTVDLLILADSRDRQDFQALLDLFRRVLGPDVPCLLVTYGTRSIDKQKLAASCLSKPFLAEDLIRQVQKTLGQEVPQRDCGGSTQPEQSTQGMPFRGLRVLAAEDNAIAGKVIKALLEKQGCDVTLVDDGEQALDRANADSFALALVDVHMPKLDGIAFTRAYRLREEPGKRLPIIALTANAAEDIKTKCVEAGMDDFLGKPISPQALSELVRRYSSAGEGMPKRSAPG